MTLKIRQCIAALALIGYASLMVLGFLHLLSMTHMHFSMEDCPFTKIEYNICSLSFGEHIEVFKEILFFIVLVGIFYIPIAYFSTVFFTSTPPPPKLFLYAKKHTIKREYHLPQKLYSSGLLNPKVYLL